MSSPRLATAAQLMPRRAAAIRKLQLAPTSQRLWSVSCCCKCRRYSGVFTSSRAGICVHMCSVLISVRPCKIPCNFLQGVCMLLQHEAGHHVLQGQLSGGEHLQQTDKKSRLDAHLL